MNSIEESCLVDFNLPFEHFIIGINNYILKFI